MSSLSRPLVRVFDSANADQVSGKIALPAVFNAPIRIDIVHSVHKDMAKNSRQAYAVNRYAGAQTSAESWGTGRAVARIPRVAGSGTHRAGQAAFGNMCRGGRMFMPTKVWRNWHVKISVGQRRFATVAALAASAVPALVMARGHHVGRIPEIPLVVSSAAEGTTKTANAVKLLERFGAKADVDRVQRTMKIRPGKGKARNRKYNVRKGPLVIYDKDDGITRAFRNIPGVSLCQVTRLNLLELAPGGHVGRFIIWTEGAFKKLDSIWGTQRTLSQHKKGYRVPRSQVTNSDISRIISSAEIQSVIRAARPRPAKRGIKPNPLVNKKVMEKLNPFAAAQARASYSVAKAAELKKAGKKPRAHKTKKVKPAKPATAPKNPAKKKAHLQRVKKLRAANKAAFRARIQK